MDGNTSGEDGLLTTMAGAVSTAAPGAAVALATPEQLEAERFAIRFVGDPEARSLLDMLRAEFATDPMYARPQGAAQLDVALRQWATSLALRETAGDPEAPRIIWVGDATPRTWFGHTLGGASLAGDNPDAHYRHAFVDGGAVYEVTGRLPANPPAQFSIEPIAGLAGVIPPTGTLTGALGTTSGPALLTDQDIRADAEGNFRIVLGGPAPADGRNHLALPDVPMAINFRDVLSDWRQQAIPLAIRRLSLPGGRPLTTAELRARTIEHLPAYIRHWVAFKDSWLGGIAPNSFKGPLGRAGAWSYILAGRYRLDPDQAIVLTAHSGGAGYQGAQVTDHWQITLNNAVHQSSLNNGQVVRNPDGSATYVIAPKDPGAANWLDTAGCSDGFFFVRWQLFGPDFQPDKVVSEFEVIDAADLAGRADIPMVTPEQRREQLAQRAIDYGRRLSA